MNKKILVETVLFEGEIVLPKNHQIDRFKINHGGYTSFTDPPTTRKPRGL